ncbi:MAG: glycosyltransferase family 2 protein [Nocardioides sp.]|nr:glycosyltransferase family 2 protein [Nocardioides sp.]
MRHDVPTATTALVIPMHNEAAVIGGVVTTALAQFATVVCVDDGSTDDCAALARQAGALVVRHPTNLGQGAALVTGIRHALRLRDIEYVVTFDADGQHDVQDAVSMVQMAHDLHLQVVLGSRFLEPTSDIPAHRRAVLRAAVQFTRSTTGLDVTDAHNGLRVLRRDAAERIQLRLHGMSHASEILSVIARESFSYAEHPVTVSYTDYSRAKGQRSYNALNILYDLVLNRLRAVA